MVLSQFTRTDEAFRYIRQKIIEGEIAFGERLHITNLAEETGFSNTPIREALAKLEMLGLAESYPHKGVFVVSPSEKDVHEMVDGRNCLELFMAKSVIDNVSAEDIPKLRKACEAAAITRPNPDHSFEEGLHGYFAKIAGNDFMFHLYQRVMALLNVLYIQAMRTSEDREWIRKYKDQHYAEELVIVESIADRDLSQLEKAVTTHIINFGDFIISSLKKWPPKGVNWAE